MKDIEIIYPQKIIDVQYIQSDFGDNKAFDKLTFYLEFQRIEFFPICDTDEIRIEISNLTDTIEKRSNSLLDYCIGKSFFTGWKCINSQGYFDLFVIGLDTIQPAMCILSEGSSLKILTIER